MGVRSFLYRKLPPLLPRRKSLRRRVELMGAEAAGAFALLIICIFLFSSVDRLLIRSDQFAAVVAAVLVDLANSNRAAQNVGALTINPALVAAAQAKAEDMAAKGYFAHVSPEGKDPWYWFSLVGYDFDYAGENLAVDFSDSADVNAAWLNSPTHRDNILNRNYTEVGIATAEGFYRGRPTTFVVQMFGKPRARSLAPVSARARGGEELASVSTSVQPVRVLGEMAQLPQATQPPPAPASPVSDFTVQHASMVAAVPDYAPWWTHLIASPRTTLHLLYYIVGIVVLLALAATIGLEWRAHHRKAVVAASSLLILMIILFATADYLIFSEPVIALALR